jgi:hypothetical protein
MLRALKPVIFLFGVLVTLVILALGFFYMASGPTFTYRYRLTIEVDTPQGAKSGSSVIETALENNHNVKWAPPEARKFTATTRGQAVFVDLGDGKHIIALLAMGKTADSDPEFRTIAAGSLGVRPYEPAEVFPAIAKASAAKVTVSAPASLIPTLVLFEDLSDPRTARVVPPDDLETSFGPGYKFLDATIEFVSAGTWPLNEMGLTGQPITDNIRAKLPWLGKQLPWAKIKWQGGPYIDTRPFKQGEYRLQPDQFRKGLSR